MEDFTLLKMIGKGSYGKVLLVKKNDSEEVFAMKMLKKDYIARRNQIEHTRTERSILEKINHPYIVKLRYAFQNPKKLYFVLEYCPGGELFFHLSRAGKFEETRAIFYAACVVLAIEHLHKSNIVYRDLKPENILIDSQGFAKITDFGLSKENIMDSTSAKTFCGTPEYLAPEVLSRQGHGKAVDWWSLGALIFEMLTGLPPFYNAKDRERMFQDIMQSEVRFPANISPNARSLLEQLFVKDPVARLGGSPRDAEEIKEHPWFASVNWTRLLNREENPPFVPALEGIYDTKYVDTEFTVMPAVDSVSNEARFEASSPTYQDFSYISGSMQRDARSRAAKYHLVPIDVNVMPTMKKNAKLEAGTVQKRTSVPFQTNYSDLLPSIFAGFLCAENDRRAGNSLEGHEISPAVRARMVDWMVEVIAAFGMSLETFFLSVKLMDYFLSKTQEKYADGDVHIIGMTCMLIASKFEEVEPFRVKSMVELIGKHKFPPESLLSLELTILDCVNYQLFMVTPLQVLEYICEALGLHHCVKRTAEVILVINQMSVLVQDADPSHQAVASLHISLTSLSHMETIPLVLPFAHGKDMTRLCAIMRSNIAMYRRENPSSPIEKHLRFTFLDTPGPLFSFESPLTPRL